MNKLTNDEIEELVALAAKSTPGPWFSDVDRSGAGAAVVRRNAVVAHASRAGIIPGLPGAPLVAGYVHVCEVSKHDAPRKIDERAANLDFIAKAHELSPRLAIEVLELRRKLVEAYATYGAEWLKP